MGFRDMHVRVILQEMLKNSIHNIEYKITLLKLLPYLPGANELIEWGLLIWSS